MMVVYYHLKEVKYRKQYMFVSSYVCDDGSVGTQGRRVTRYEFESLHRA